MEHSGEMKDSEIYYQEWTDRSLIKFALTSGNTLVMGSQKTNLVF